MIFVRFQRIKQRFLCYQKRKFGPKHAVFQMVKNILHDTNKRVFDGPKIIWLIFTFLTKLLLNRKAQQGGITIDHSELFPLTHVFLDPLLIIHVQI